MNYRLVRQFSINASDNFFNFFYKIVDFFKLLIEVWWAFYDIWEAFFLIFFNLFMYVYYLFIFIIDKLTESEAALFFWRTIPKRVPYKPGKVYIKDLHNPIPAAYVRQAAVAVSQGVASAVSAAKETVAAPLTSVRKQAAGARGSIVKKLMEFISTILGAVWAVISFPFRKIGNALSGKIKPVPREEQPGSKSLIDEYLKEYEQRRKS